MPKRQKPIDIGSQADAPNGASVTTATDRFTRTILDITPGYRRLADEIFTLHEEGRLDRWLYIPCDPYQFDRSKLSDLEHPVYCLTLIILIVTRQAWEHARGNGDPVPLSRYACIEAQAEVALKAHGKRVHYHFPGGSSAIGEAVVRFLNAFRNASTVAEKQRYLDTLVGRGQWPSDDSLARIIEELEGYGSGRPRRL